MTHASLTNPNRIYSASWASQVFALLRDLFTALLGLTAPAIALVGLWLFYDRSYTLALVFFIILATVLALAVASALPVLHPRRSQSKCTPADFGIAQWDDVRFSAVDRVELSGWFIPPDPQSDGATLILVHGLGGNRGDMLEHAQMLVSKGYGVLLFDLRNHGASAGTLTTLGYSEAEDVCGAFAYLLTRQEVNPQRIGLVGYSMGAAAVLRAAARIAQVRAAIAESAYTSLEDNIAQGVTAKTGLPPFPFAPVMIWLGERMTGLRIHQIRPIDDVAQMAPRPLLFVHGAQDSTVDAKNSVELYQAASGPKGLYLIDKAGHTGLASADPAEFERRITGFLDWSLRGIDRRHAPRSIAD